MRLFIISLAFGVLCLGVSAAAFQFADFDSLKDDFVKNKITSKLGNTGSFNFSFDSSDDESDSNSFDNYKKEEIEKVFSKSEVEDVKIEGAFGRVKLVKSISGKFEVKASYPADAKWLKVSAFLVGKQLYIKTIEEDEADDDNMKNYKNGVKIDLAIPDKLVGLELDLAFGSIKASDLSFKNIEIDLAAGDLEFKNLKVDEKVEIQVAAGNIDLKNVTVKNKVLVEAAAGDIKFESLKTDDLEIEAMAGNVEVNLISKKPSVSIEAAAGRVVFGIDEKFVKNYSLEASASLGVVEVKGDYTKKDDAYVFGKGEGNVELRAQLGKITVL